MGVHLFKGYLPNEKGIQHETQSNQTNGDLPLLWTELPNVLRRNVWT